jgi:AcrR family transcriptional regulator
MQMPLENKPYVWFFIGMDSAASDTVSGRAAGPATGAPGAPGEPGAQARKSERMRDAILEAAVRRIAATGYHATSIKKIASDGGFSIGALQHHFPSKEALMIALVERALARAGRFAERWVSERGREGASLGDLVTESWKSQIQSPWYLAMLEVLVAARTDPGLKAGIAPALEEYSRQGEARIAARLSGREEAEAVGEAAFLLTVSRCMMGGFLAQDALVMPPAETDRFVARWGAMLGELLHARGEAR